MVLGLNDEIGDIISKISGVDNVRTLTRCGKSGKARGFVCDLAVPFTEFATEFNELDTAGYLVLHSDDWNEYKALVINATYDLFWSAAFDKRFARGSVPELERKIKDLVARLKTEYVIDFDAYLDTDYLADIATDE